MSRRKKVTKNIADVDFSKPNNDVDEVVMTQDQYIELYSTALSNVLNTANRVNQNYSPMMAQSYLQDINISPINATQQQLTTWLKQPAKYSKELSNVSQFLSNTVMQYERAVNHFASILSFNYELIPLDKLPKDKGEKEEYLKNREDKLDVLKKMQVKKQNRKVAQNMVENGVAFYIINETSDFITLYELPKEYCYITGVWNLGYTFALDLSWFDKMNGMEDVMPELVEAYKKYVQIRNIKGVDSSTVARMQYYPMSVLDSWCFSFDMIHADTSPPLKPVFKDATEILGYKDMLKQKTALDTVSLIVQQLPKDKDGNLKISYPQGMEIAQMTQSCLPRGVKTIVTPCDAEQFNFTNSQSQNNIIGLGEELFWRSVGISGSMMGESSSSALTLKYALKGDVGFIDHIYSQFENFAYVQLNKKKKKYKWTLKYFGDRYSNEDEIKNYQSCVQGQNLHIGRLYALWGYEPFEWENLVELENELGLKDKLKPIITGSQMSGKESSSSSKKSTTPEKRGRKKSDDSQLGDAGAITRQYESNENSLKV